VEEKLTISGPSTMAVALLAEVNPFLQQTHPGLKEAFKELTEAFQQDRLRTKLRSGLLVV
jgi:hypothetical protein